MPVITYEKKEIFNLLGRKLSDKELKLIIDSLKPEVSYIDEREVEVEHFSDRPDMFGVEGLVRSIKTFLTGRIPEYKSRKYKIEVNVKRVTARPYIACAVIRNIKIDESLIKSLMNIQEVLHETWGRKRRKVAIGIHDLDKIAPPITYTAVKPSETMVPLGWNEEVTLEEVLKTHEKGVEYGDIIKPYKKWPVFIDSKGIFSFPPIINSERTRVTEKTRNLFVELTGTERKIVEDLLNIVVTNLADRGGVLESVKVKYPGFSRITPDLRWKKMKIDLEYVNQMLGMEFSKKDVKKLLKKMGMRVVFRGNKGVVFIPPYRLDVVHQIDLVEDIAIAYGYNNFLPELPNLFTKGGFEESEVKASRVRDLMIGLGFQEIIRPTLTNKKHQFEKMNLREEEVVEIENPVSQEYTCLRIWVLPSLLEVLSCNKHVEYPQKLFELGEVVKIDLKAENRTRMEKKLACVISDSKIGYEAISSVLEALMMSLKVKYSLKRKDHPSFIPGRCAAVIVDGKEVGILGEVHPLVLNRWEIEMPVVAFELNISSILHLLP